MKNGRNMKTKAGFTLVEIMIVVAIIGLLAVVGIPTILGTMKRAQTKAMERNVQDVLRAKGMCLLPPELGGVNAGEGSNVDADIFDHLRGFDSIEDLNVGTYSMTIGPVGTLPSYNSAISGQ